jgi:hypothetical protein
MKVAIIGTPQSGKTLLFSALSKTKYSELTNDPSRKKSTINVEDKRLWIIKDLVGNKKRLVFPQIELIDTPPIYMNADNKDQTQAVLAEIREVQGLILMISLFEFGNMDRNKKLESVMKTIETVKSELYLADLEIIQKRIEKLKEKQKKPSQFNENEKKEMEILERLYEDLQEGKVKVLFNLSTEDKKRLSGFAFLSLKPIMFIVNISELDIDLLPYIDKLSIEDSKIKAIALKLEAELLGMEEKEQISFMKDYGLEKLTLTELPNIIYNNMGYNIFFTIGKNEIAGRGIEKNGTALEAAGKIHTDMTKGFIGAEVTSFNDFVSSSGLKKQRLEGKTYKVQDGDIIYFRFNV